LKPPNRPGLEEIWGTSATFVEAEPKAPVLLARAWVWRGAISDAEGGEDIATSEQMIGLRVAYNGRTDFIIAVDADLTIFKSKILDENVKLGSAGIGLRYYF
jgi:hypothetical protein